MFEEVISNAMDKQVGQMKKLQQESFNITVQFVLKGHTISISGYNPDTVIKAVEATKKNRDKLSEIGKR